MGYTFDPAEQQISPSQQEAVETVTPYISNFNAERRVT